MLTKIVDELTGPGMIGNIVAEIFGIVVTVLVIERYLAWWENRKKRASRELLVSSLERRLDQLALDWGRVLNFLTMIGNRKIVDRMEEFFESYPQRLDAMLPESVRAHLRSESASQIRQPAPPQKDRESIDKMLVLKLEHITSRLEDVLVAVDGAAVVMSPSMLDSIVELREALLSNLRGITDLRDLLANPTPEQASNVITSAMTASLSCNTYVDLLGRLWSSIPARGDSAAPVPAYLPAIREPEKQRELLCDFLYVHFPDYDPEEMVRRAKSAK